MLSDGRGFAFQMNGLRCPRCRAPYPRWRVIVSPGIFRCLSCDARLTFSLDSTRRAGWIVSLALIAAVTLSDLVFGFDQVGTWQFLASLLAFTLVFGQIVRSLLGVLVLRDDFPRVSRGPR
jgi:hypothetical protein